MLKKNTNIDPPVISIRGLTKKYNQSTVVNNLNLDIQKSCFALLGPNGAGKTTTFLMLLGLVKPTDGTASILGKDILKESVKIRKNIGFLPESVGFYPNMTGREHLKFILDIKTNIKDKRENVDALLKWCGLNERYWDKKTRIYSQGMRQRLGLAQAFAGSPKIVFLDEPLSNVDPLGRNDMINKIKIKQKEGATIIISSHIILELEKLADSVSIIDNGIIKNSNTIISLAKSFGYNEYEIISDNYYTDIKLNELNKVLLSEKDLFLSPPQIFSDKIIFKSNKPHKIKSILKEYNEFNLRPVTGTLEKIYKKVMRGGKYE